MYSGIKTIENSIVRLKTAYSLLPLSILLIDVDENVIFANPAAETLFANKVPASGRFRCGDFLGCRNCNETDAGCGYSTKCPDCPLLQAIRSTLAGKDANGAGEMPLERRKGLPPLWIEYQNRTLDVGGRRLPLLCINDLTVYKQQTGDSKEADAFGENSRRMLARGSPRHNEKWVAYPDRRKVPLDTRKAPLRDSEENGIGTRDIGRDITKQRKAEETLRLQALVLDQIADRVTVTDLDGVITYINEAEVRSLGYRREELIGASTQKFGEDPERGATQKEIVEQTLQEGTWRGEVVNFAADGSEIIMDCRTRVVCDRNGTPMALAGIATDITQRKRMEEALRKAEREKEWILDAQSELIAYEDTNLKVLWANKAAYDSVHMKREEIIGRRCYEIWAQRDTPCEDCPIVKCMKTQQQESLEKSTPDGRTWFIRGYPVRDPDGTIVGALEISQDITQRRQDEVERKNLQAQLVQAQKVESIGRLAGGVAHDLNNLLSPILGYAEMLAEDLAPEDTKLESVKEILHAGLKARDLVRQLLAFSRKQTLALKRIDINHVLKGFEKLLRRTIQEDIDINCVMTSTPLPVMADIGQIEQVIMNLAVNAADAMPSGGVLTIETMPAVLDEEYAEMHPGVTPGDHALMSISDTGSGMDKKTLENIFEPFFTTKGKWGTGLGLATVYGIVKQHNGNIWVYSEPDKGTIFKVYLPLTGEARVQQETPGRPAVDLKGSEGILLVEDDDQVRSITNTILVRYGYSVISAKDSDAALNASAKHKGPLDLLLTDVILPGMNGKELFEQLSIEYPGLKVLYMSGYTTDVIAHRGILDEGIQLIQKPFAVKALAAKVREVLDQG